MLESARRGAKDIGDGTMNGVVGTSGNLFNERSTKSSAETS